MIEAELKARLRDPDAVRARLAERAAPEHAIYRDTYFDTPDGALSADGRELRIRSKRTGVHVRHVLTFKAPAVDADSESKPEHESVVADRDAVEAIVASLGYEAFISFTKNCDNYAITHAGCDALATVVTVPELDDTFLEVEALVDETEVPAALAALRELLAELGVDPAELTTETYTGAVAAHRAMTGGSTTPL